MPLINRCINYWCNRNELVIPCSDIHFTTSTAVRTCGSCPFSGESTLENRFVFERSSRTVINAGATTHTRTFSQSRAGVGDNLGFVSPVKDLPNKLTLYFFTNPNTAVTQNALRHIDVNVWMRIVKKFWMVATIKI